MRKFEALSLVTFVMFTLNKECDSETAMVSADVAGEEALDMVRDRKAEGKMEEKIDGGKK